MLKEVNTCPHYKLKNLGIRKIRNKSTARCRDCQRGDDLVLCLSCGYLGCVKKKNGKKEDNKGQDKTPISDTERPQSPSQDRVKQAEANGHGFEHYLKKPGHCVYVHFGGSVAEGKPVIYC